MTIVEECGIVYGMPTPGFSWRFSAAIARLPGRSVAQGIRAVDHGAPDYAQFRREHRDYVRALERAGLQVTVLPALAELGYEVMACAADGFIDGGDILATEKAILVGLSGRTDSAGCAWLQSVLRRWAYPVLAVRTPEQVLHFKSDCCVLDGDTVLATGRLAAAACFAPFRVLTVPRGEEAAANSIRINDTVLVPAGFPATAELLAREGFAVESVAVSQASLLDGGLSCMSLRLPAACSGQ